MPHDCNGKELKVGDRILVPYVVKSITMNEDFCNLTAETVHPMYPQDHKTSTTFNAKQVQKQEG